jgi:polyferredoxin
MMKQIMLIAGLITLICFSGFAQDDEFKPMKKSEVTSATPAAEEDEFKPMNQTEVVEEDEFKPLDSASAGSPCSSSCSQSCGKNLDETCAFAEQEMSAETRKLYWILAALGLAVIAGFLVRFNISRKARTFFLLGSLLTFGFYNGGCPCMISGFEYTFLNLFGYTDRWIDALWFLGLIPVTYIFGKVWCGWICHLGAVQEFLYRPGKIKLFRSVMAQKVMQWMRYTLIAALIIQLAVMGSIYWCKIDPFLAIFNLQLNYNQEWTSGILLVLLLLTSLFSYRPFCRSVCPVGIALGWVSHIPGASVIGIEGKCASCKMCNNACDIDAIIRKDKVSVLDNKECIMCGDCIESCPQGGLKPLRKNRKNKVTVNCGPVCE